MDQTEKQRLEFVANILKNWDPAGSDTEILYAFGILDEISINKHKAGWDKVRTALNSNPKLDDEWLKNSLTDTSLSRNGRWWWDPSQW